MKVDQRKLAIPALGSRNSGVPSGTAAGKPARKGSLTQPSSYVSSSASAREQELQACKDHLTLELKIAQGRVRNIRQQLRALERNEARIKRCRQIKTKYGNSIP